MANVFEQLGDFTVTRLRAPGAAYLSGAVQGIGPTPYPIAIAVGPAAVALGNTVGNDQIWGLGVAMPPAADIVWVLTAANPNLLFATSSLPALLVFAAITDIADNANVRGPIFVNEAPVAWGLGAADQLTGIHGGDNLWMPLDPAATTLGFDVGFQATAGAAGPTAGEYVADLSQVIFIGYPVNFWGTGALWAKRADRGS